MSAVIDSGHAHDEHGPYGGIMRWVTTTNHKDIGTLYLWFSFTMFLVGGMLALAIRAELFQPGLQFWHPEFFNQLTTMHGLIMEGSWLKNSGCQNCMPGWNSSARKIGRAHV